MSAPETLAEALRALHDAEHQVALRCAQEASRRSGQAAADALRALAAHAGIVEDGLVALARDRAIPLETGRAIVRDLARAVRRLVPSPADDAALRAVLADAERCVAKVARIALLASRERDGELARWALAAGRARAQLLDAPELTSLRPAPEPHGEKTVPTSGPRLVLVPSIS